MYPLDIACNKALLRSIAGQRVGAGARTARRFFEFAAPHFLPALMYLSDSGREPIRGKSRPMAGGGCCLRTAQNPLGKLLPCAR